MRISLDPHERGLTPLTSVSHSEELLRVLAVAFTAQRLGHREAQFKAVVVVRLDLSVPALTPRGRVGGVLAKVSSEVRKYNWGCSVVAWLPCGLEATSTCGAQAVACSEELLAARDDDER